MSNYCDFNPRLFKEFTSMKVKIKPALADDWEIIPVSYNTNQGFSLKSKKISQQVADIDLRRFLRFCKEQNLTIEGLKLKGTYIVGNDRSVYTEEMYNQWKEKFEKRTEVITEKADAKVGHEYKTPCGQHLVYLGYRYVANIKDAGFKSKDLSQYTKISKKHFCMPAEKAKCSAHYGVDEVRNKFTNDLGQKYTPEECDEFLLGYYNVRQDLICFEKEKPAKDVKFGLIEITLPKKYFKDYEEGRALFFEKDNVLYSTPNAYNYYVRMKYYGPEIQPPKEPKPIHTEYSWVQQQNAYEKSQVIEAGFYAVDYATVDRETFIIAGRREGWSSKQKPTIKADRLLRIGIIN